MASSGRLSVLHRVLALVVCLLGVPLVIGLPGFFQDVPIRLGEESPRTVIAPERIQVEDAEATELLRREAANQVQPVVVDDPQARGEIVQRVRDVFEAAFAAREPAADGTVPPRIDQIDALEERLTVLDDEGLRRLVSLSDAQLQQTATEAEDVAELLARMRITEDDVAAVAEGALQTELALAAFPEGVAEGVVEPVLRDALQPTVRVDAEATAEERNRVAAEIEPVLRTYQRNSAIVSAGDVVDEVELMALQRLDLEGAEPAPELVRAAALAAVLTVVVGLYVRAYRRALWRDPKRLVLLAVLQLVFTVLLIALSLMQLGGDARLYALPIGAIAMLAAILFDASIGVLLVVPCAALVAYVLPASPGLTAYAALAGVVSIPLVTRLSARGQLRRAAWQSTLAYGILAAAFAALFDGSDAVVPAALAGLIGGVLSAVIVNGSLPFLESVFGILTATSLLDLADRNHPLLRELETKALGSYNHSIMVSTMCERACRAIGADSLLASVAALYHDIGKVTQPYFFVENQFAIANPHDQLDNPRESALIIQRHVQDGVEMARVYRLPPEVVDGIRTHHGTTLVTYFFRKAIEQAHAAGEPEPDEAPFRYKGRKPQTRELAVLMLADCCEGASRAAAQEDRNLSRDALESIVRGLVSDRVEDGQLDESSLTFADLRRVQESFIETLVGVYHPRIAYPADPRQQAALRAAGLEEAPPAAAAPDAEPAAQEAEPSAPRRRVRRPAAVPDEGDKVAAGALSSRAQALEAGLSDLARRALGAGRKDRH